ncbi:MAG: glycosyltransferase [Deltaproteobacteria bacterium]|nr:glycosyltransferase [Deltaproteobacteria bacterium]
MRPLRVMFIEASSGGVVGGSLTGLYHLIRGLDRSAFACSMVLYEPKTIEADLAALGVPVYHVSRRRVPKQHALLGVQSYQRAKRVGVIARGLRCGRQAVRLAVEEGPAALGLRRVIRRERPDVLHLGNGLRANFDAVLAARLTGTPVVCHIKGFEKYSTRERFAAAKIDALVCMTQAVQAHCAANGVVARRNEVVYDALDEDGFCPARSPAQVRAELPGLAPQTPCAGIVGNIQEWKGQAVVVEAMALVHRRVPQARCLIVGGAHRAGAAYELELRRRVREAGLENVVHFTGFRADIADVINALDVVVHASVRPEPFGRVILEGMLLRKPVVAAAAGGVPELIADGDTGFLVPPGDAAALAERLITLLGDPELRQRIGSRAQAWARERFSLAHHVASMTGIYHEVTRTH